MRRRDSIEPCDERGLPISWKVRDFSRETWEQIKPRPSARDPQKFAEVVELERELRALAGHLVPEIEGETFGWAATLRARRENGPMETLLHQVANAAYEISRARETALGLESAETWAYRRRRAGELIADVRRRLADIERAAAHPVAAE